MPVFFNGRLWVSPATMSVVDDSAMYNRNLSVGNVVALLGKSIGGEPHKALRFGSAAEARAVLRDGELLRAVEKAFDPSAQTAGPATVVAVRVNPALRASLTLKDSLSEDAIVLTSQDFGAYTNQIRVKVESGSVTGKKLTTQFGNDYFSVDNLERRAFSVLYTGTAQAVTITITNATVVLAVAATVTTIELADYATIGAVVDRINAIPGFAAEVLDGNETKPALNGLDHVSVRDVKTAKYTAYATLQAVVDWFNGQGEGFIQAQRAATAKAPPANMAFAYLSGGTNGVVTNSEWQKAFNVLQTEDVQWVVPVSSEPSVHAMADTHCSYMSNVARMERRCIVGGGLGATDDEAIAAAKAFNSDRTSYVHLGYYDYNAAGALTLYPAYLLAALLAGMFSGVNPGTALTNKSIKVRGLERKLRNPTDTDRLINGGVLCVEETQTGYKVVKSISTWLTNTNYNRVEVSVGVALDFVSRNVRNILDPLRGAKGTPQLLSEAVSRVDSALRELARPEPIGPGVLAGDAENPPYKGITATLEGDVLRVAFQASPVIPVNYIPIAIYAVPYAGSASA